MSNAEQLLLNWADRLTERGARVEIKRDDPGSFYEYLQVVAWRGDGATLRSVTLMARKFRGRWKFVTVFACDGGSTSMRRTRKAIPAFVEAYDQ